MTDGTTYFATVDERGSCVCMPKTKSHATTVDQFFTPIFIIWVPRAYKCTYCYLLYVTVWSGWVQWNGVDGSGCVRPAHVIACCHSSPSPWWMTCGGVRPQLLTWEVTSLGKENSLCVDRKCWWKLKVNKFICPALFSNEVFLNSCEQGQ